MRFIKYPEKESWNDLLKRPAIDNTSLEETVQSVLSDIEANGQTAVDKYTRQFDKVDVKQVLVSEAEFSEAGKLVSNELKHAIQLAKKNIETFHAAQKESSQVIETMQGVACWRKSIAIQKVGLYIPGGTAPLFSTILMLGVPAKLAGCEEVILCSPPDPNGNINPCILYTAQLLGITNVFKVGGVQAIGAMAYGTELIPRVYKIFGPGNQYVTCAKQLITKKGVAIDMPAGPSELAVLVDNTCIPEFVAADLLSQAEHRADSQEREVSTQEEV